MPEHDSDKQSPSFHRRRFLQQAGGLGLAAAALGSVAPARTIKADQTLRVALIGKDGHTGLVLGSIPKLQNVVWAAYAKSRPEEDESWARKQAAFSSSTRIYADYRELLEKEDVDIVVPCLPMFQNAEVTVAAARKGIHVITEKPVATEMRDLELVEQAVGQSGIRLSALLNMRCDPVFLAARKAVREGRIGEPVLMTSQKSYRFGDSRPWFYKERRTLGGSIPWAGIHAFDYMRWISGVEYARVTAHHGNKTQPGYPGCEDHAGVLFQLANGGTAMCNIDYLRPKAAPTHGDDRLRIAGSEGVIEVRETEEKTVLITRSSAPVELELPPPMDLFSDYVSELRGRGRHIIESGEAILISRVSLKAREAADRHSWLEV